MFKRLTIVLVLTLALVLGFAPYRQAVFSNVLSDADWEKQKGDYLPSDSDRVYIESLMQPVIEPGKFAGWIAPPDGGVNNLGLAYQYVRLN